MPCNGSLDDLMPFLKKENKKGRFDASLDYMLNDINMLDVD